MKNKNKTVQFSVCVCLCDMERERVKCLDVEVVYIIHSCACISGAAPPILKYPGQEVGVANVDRKWE